MALLHGRVAAILPPERLRRAHAFAELSIRAAERRRAPADTAYSASAPRRNPSMHALRNALASDAALIDLHDVDKVYDGPAGGCAALSACSLAIARGEFTAIVGQSGSGKSTLLNLIAGVDRPTRGEIHVAGTALHLLPEHALSAWRGRAVGIVFQFFQLLPTLTAAENVMLPMDFCRRWPPRERRPRALALLERLGVADQADKLPGALSGGQQQRVAIARALANEPALLLADEPTGNLDSRSAAALLELFAALVAAGQTLVMVTHDRGAQDYASRTITLRDGRVADDGAGSRA
jgi:putative ABC transport system ATP-binding protein